MSAGKTSFWGVFGAVWGVLGVVSVLGRGLHAVSPYALKMSVDSFGAIEWLALVFSLAFMGYAEGYKGFQTRFAPRVAARALFLRSNPTVIRVFFAPLFCMGFFYATRKRKIVAFGVTLMVILLIGGVRCLAEPWRGIVDAGVVLGLLWGLLSVLYFSVRAFFGRAAFTVSPETPCSVGE